MNTPSANPSRKSPILVTGAPRSGTTWTGKMLSLTYRVKYIDELFNPALGDLGLNPEVWFEYITAENEQLETIEAIRNYMRFTSTPNHTLREGLRNRLVSTVQSITGWPRPLVKDPIAAFSSEWLACTGYSLYDQG